MLLNSLQLLNGDGDPEAAEVPALSSASAVTWSSAAAIFARAVSFDISCGTANGSPYATTFREKGFGTRWWSQESRNNGHELEKLIGRIHALVIRASRTTPDCTTRAGPRGPSTVRATLCPERT